VTTALLTALTDRDALVRGEAAQSLAGREGQEVTTALLTALTDPDPVMRRSAAAALAGREGQEVTTALLAALTDLDWGVGQQAARAIQERSSPQDLLIVTQRARSLAPDCIGELLPLALSLTIRHYRDLTPAEQAEVRSVTAWLTSIALNSPEAVRRSPSAPPAGTSEHPR
jgi:HEAT repeat protein